jgi:hypothetical protein
MYKQGTRGGALPPPDDKPTVPLTGNLGGPGNQNGVSRCALSEQTVTTDPTARIKTGR